MSRKRTWRLFLLAAAAAMTFPAAAGAHATLVSSDPANGAVVARAPAAVQLTFDDAVAAAGGNDVVANGSGRSVLAGRAHVVARGRVLVLPLRARLPRGDYSVRWRVLSDDGHLIGGVLAFGVGSGRAPPHSVLAAPSGGPPAEDVLARWLLFAGLLVAAGTAIFAAVVPRGVRPSVDVRARAGLVASGLVLFVVGAAELLREASVHTRFGTALVVGIGIAAAGIVVALASAVDRRVFVFAGLAAVALVPIPSIAGHALDSGVPWPNVLVDVAHVGAAALWVGVLVGLLTTARSSASSLLPRVSALALASVLVLAATGVVRAVFELRAFHQLWSTGYGRAVLVKSGLLLVLVLLGWANRRNLGAAGSIRRRVVAELVLLAGVVVAVAFLTQLRPGRDAPRATATAPVQPPFATLSKPPPDALVLANEAGPYAVALAVRGRTADVFVLSPAGGAADGLSVEVNGHGTSSCGHGCYRTQLAAGRPPVVVDVGRATATFLLPQRAPRATALVRRATRAFRRARSVVYVERLASSPTQRIRTRWRLEAPNRVAYTIAGGAEAVIIGERRWDRTRGQPWERSTTTPLAEPRPVWGGPIANAHLLGATPTTLVLAWANPQIPAWFTARFDRRTLLPQTLQMTAAAHFMHHRYVGFNGPRRIRPPRP